MTRVVFGLLLFLFLLLCFSERADPSYCKDRITEGANINKSLVTLGIVISTLGIAGRWDDWSGREIWKITLIIFIFQNR